MQTVLLILVSETGEFAGGNYNKSLHLTAKKILEAKYKVIETVVEEGYSVDEEIDKWGSADYIIYQYPIYWFMMPPSLKKYMDDVYAYGEFFAFNDGPYGSGGLMKGKKVMLSTTWNAPEEAFGGDFFDGAERDAMLLPMRKAQAYCGMDELPHFSAHNIIKNPDFETNNNKYKQHLKSVFDI